MLTCGAKTRSGMPCQRRPSPGKLRCHLHGGYSTGPRTAEGLAKANSARAAGRVAWVERMRAAKAAGSVSKFPCGRPARGTGTIADRGVAALASALLPAGGPVVGSRATVSHEATTMPNEPDHLNCMPAWMTATAAARAATGDVVAAAAPPPLVPLSAWEDASAAEKLTILTCDALDVTRATLAMDPAAEQDRLAWAKLRQNTATSVISTAARLKSEELSRRADHAKLQELLSALREERPARF